MKQYHNYAVRTITDLRQMYRESAELYTDRTLFLQKEHGSYRPYTYRQYAADVEALGTALCAHVPHGGRILLLGENSYAWATAYMAVVCGVGIVAPLDKDISPEELKKVASHCNADAILYSDRYAKMAEVLPSSVTRIPFSAFPTYIEEGNQRIIDGDRTYLDTPIDPDAMSVLLFTSGTTDRAKGVMLSHRNICFNLTEMCKMIYIDENDTFLSVLPLHHVYECTCGFLCPLYRGASVAFAEGLRQILRNMQETSPTVMLCVPLFIEMLYHRMWKTIQKQDMEKRVRTAINVTNAIPGEKTRMLAKRKALSKIHKSFGGKLRMMISGGAPIDPAVLHGLRELGILAYQGYGLTECAPLAALNRDLHYRDASVGMATPNTLLDIYDVQDDGTGEIRFKGQNVMLGYFNMPELTREVIRDGWFYTGDLGYMDEEGFLYVTGRKKNVIVNANGRQIFPEELETLLDRTPFVKESVVVGYWNERKKDYDIVALIYPDIPKMIETYGKNDTEAHLRLELRRAISTVNAQVLAYKHIHTYVLRNEEFPKNSSRKIKRAGLAESAYDDYLKIKTQKSKTETR